MMKGRPVPGMQEIWGVLGDPWMVDYGMLG